MELMNKKIVEANIQLQDENKELKKIIKTAIEYTEENQCEHKYIDRGGFEYTDGHFLEETEDLLKILKGEEYEQ